MRRALALLAAVLGGLLVLAGTSVAVLTGPDDTAHLPTHPVPGAAGTAMILPDLLAWDGVTVAVRATGSDGGVFLGAAHPVDAQSYVAGVGTFRVNEVTRQGTFGGRRQDGDLPLPAVAPAAATFWSDHTEGTGTRQLLLPLTGAPTAVVAVATAADGGEGAPAPSGSLRMDLGVQVPHAFAAGIAASALGAVLVAVSVAVRPRRRHPDHRTEPASATGPTPATDLAVMRRAGSRLAAVATGTAVLATVTGCAALPERVELGEVRRVAIHPDEVAPALASYNERAAAADALSVQHDPAGWAAADTGASLATDLYVTALLTARGETPAPRTWASTAGQVYAPAFTAYPTWILADVTSTAEGSEPLRQLTVFERATVLDPWRMGTGVGTTVDLPPSLAPGAASTASDEARARAVEVLAAVDRYMETGDGTGLDLGPLAELRAELLEATAAGSSTFTVDHMATPQEVTGPGGSVRVVAVEGGSLVLADQLMTETATAAPDYTLSFNDQAFAQVMGMTGDRDVLVVPTLLSVTVLLLDDGTARVLGADVRYRLP